MRWFTPPAQHKAIFVQGPKVATLETGWPLTRLTAKKPKRWVSHAWLKRFRNPNAGSQDIFALHSMKFDEWVSESIKAQYRAILRGACFRACLKRVRTSDANLVGKLFFNVVQTKCFVLKPKRKCMRTSWWGKCEKYKTFKQAILRDNLPY
ncbi:unnamed protein product [Phaedon cochleariae]|uniref:phospholipase A2 n=1 Tax=Phaedon cochleariae TaxID=80249 RepID=A0A9N9S8U4_PHACE|nr:unnamed protein product [Phaedon cochleariae]